MKRRRPYLPPHRAPLKIVQRFTSNGFDYLLREVREAAQRGQRVRVCRWRAPFFYVLDNGGQFLVLPGEGEPIGTFGNVAAAIAAGDAHVAKDAEARAQYEHDSDGDDSGSAA